MIGIFDSGFGWLQALDSFQKAYPQYDYIFLADQKHYPFGTKKPKQIREYAFTALQWLFDQWATIVIIACNTAAAYAIKERQKKHPQKKTLSITIPGVEKIQEDYTACKHITVLTTEWTMKSGMYSKLFDKIVFPWTSMDVIVATDLVDLVEQWVIDEEIRVKKLEKYIQKIQKQKTDCLILGCTHFPILTPTIEKYFTGDIINPVYEAVKKFWPYLKRHPDIAKKIGKNRKVQVYTTGNTKKFMEIGKNIFPTLKAVKHVDLPQKKVNKPKQRSIEKE